MERITALVSAARGLGDILRVTPLIRVCAQLGFVVDLLIAPDYADVADLVRGAPELRRVFVLPSPWKAHRVTDIEGLRQHTYTIATFTRWSHAYRHLVRAERTLVFDRAQWDVDGDVACVRGLAAELGWSGELPLPFAIPSKRRFGLPPGTVALHPGCKPDWPWKKWHGFADLAARLPHVAVIGTAKDLDNRGTYFGRPFAWPAHARSFVGSLGLSDTAALLRECAALVSNDSGLMHLGAVLGVPTFGIFGITSPRREALSVASMVAVTKGLPCETACRLEPWGRRDCAHHLECLRSLTAEEVFACLVGENGSGASRNVSAGGATT